MNDEFKRKVSTRDLATEVPADEVGPPPPPPPATSYNQLDQVSNAQQVAATSEQVPKFHGPMPSQLQKALQERERQEDQERPQQGYPPQNYQERPQQSYQQPNQPQNYQPESVVRNPIRRTGSDQLEDALSRITTTHHFEELQLPSMGVSYGDELPEGKIHLRIMTGEEEGILATPKFVRNGTAMNMIFARCIKENIDPAKLLTVDRTFLLIYLRGKSYGRDYEVEIKCPQCNNLFKEVIDLNDDVRLTYCPDDFNMNSLKDTLPNTGFTFTYKLSTGEDELELSRKRDTQSRSGDVADDTLSHRVAQLVTNLEGVTNKNEIITLLKRLPISDVSYLRNTVTEPPFGVDTQIKLGCPMCFSEFSIDLPMEANFFFPRRRPTKTE